MAFEAAVAVFDPCVLYPFHLRNILVQAAVDRLIEARWTDAIHQEWIRSLAAAAPSMPPDRLQIARSLIDAALPAAAVRDYEMHIAAVVLPDPDDRHVVAAGIAAGASVILTWNLRDFPVGALIHHGLVAQTPERFLVELYDDAPDLMVGSLANARRNLTKTLVSRADFVDVMRNQRLNELAWKIGGRLSDL
jgi:hypothetical protein